MKKNIVCIMGKSGSGKTTMIERLCDSSSDYNAVESYTTRSPREKNERGHVFVDNNFYEIHKDRAIAMYHSNHGYHSWVDDSCFSESKINLFAIDSKEFVNFRKKHSDKYKIFGIYIYVADEERKRRLKQRGNEDYFSEEEHLSYVHLGDELENCIILNTTNDSVETNCKMIDENIRIRFEE